MRIQVIYPPSLTGSQSLHSFLDIFRDPQRNIISCCFKIAFNAVLIIGSVLLVRRCTQSLSNSIFKPVFRPKGWLFTYPFVFSKTSFTLLPLSEILFLLVNNRGGILSCLMLFYFRQLRRNNAIPIIKHHGIVGSEQMIPPLPFRPPITAFNSFILFHYVHFSHCTGKILAAMFYRYICQQGWRHMPTVFPFCFTQGT